MHATCRWRTHARMHAHVVNATHSTALLEFFCCLLPLMKRSALHSTAMHCLTLHCTAVQIKHDPTCVISQWLWASSPSSCDSRFLIAACAPVRARVCTVCVCVRVCVCVCVCVCVGGWVCAVVGVLPCVCRVCCVLCVRFACVVCLVCFGCFVWKVCLVRARAFDCACGVWT
jgi:hypothetical protein